MTSVQRHCLLFSLGAALLVPALASGARAEQPTGLSLIRGGPTPAAINGIDGLNNRSCPLLVAPVDSALQPLRIPASEVAAKNRLGCLSAADAVYGPDGCPSRLCGSGRGEIPLPADAKLETPQLPEP